MTGEYEPGYMLFVFTSDDKLESQPFLWKMKSVKIQLFKTAFTEKKNNGFQKKAARPKAASAKQKTAAANTLRERHVVV